MTEAKSKQSLKVGLGAMLLANLITVLLSRYPRLLPICLFLSLVYLVYLVVRTVSLIRRPDEVASFDLKLCRWCWVFIIGPVTAFFAAVYSMEARGLDPNTLIFGYDAGWLIFQFAMEVGLIFSVATLCSPKQVRIASPRLLWKLFSAPAAVIHAFYVVGSLTRGFGQAL